jgi:hypothetical protein
MIMQGQMFVGGQFCGAVPPRVMAMAMMMMKLVRE